MCCGRSSNKGKNKPKSRRIVNSNKKDIKKQNEKL